MGHCPHSFTKMQISTVFVVTLLFSNGLAGFFHSVLSNVSSISEGSYYGGDAHYGSHNSIQGPEDAAPYNGTDCIDRKGNRVPVGMDYHPYKDSPCTICECLEDKRMMSCSSSSCDALPCLDFEVDPDACCGYSCKENGSVGRLHVQQVGRDSVIIQWTMDQRYSNVTFSAVRFHYNEAVDGYTPWTPVAVANNSRSAVVSGLKPGIQYTFQGEGRVGEMYPVVVLTLKAAQITLEPRAGNALKLERRKHMKNIWIYKGIGSGQFKWPTVFYLNLNAFDYVAVDRKVTKSGKMKFILRLHNLRAKPMGNKGDLIMQFSDVKDYRWALAHL